jgi:surface protein
MVNGEATGALLAASKTNETLTRHSSAGLNKNGGGHAKFARDEVMRPLLQTFRDMNRILLFLLLSLGMTVSAQVQVQYPYNPDANADSVISAPDLLDFLPVFAQPFTPQEIMIGDTTLTDYLQEIMALLNEQNELLGSLQGSDTRSLTYPDGLNGMVTVSHDFVNSGEFTVPIGKNFYVQQISSNGGGNAIVEVNGLYLFNEDNTHAQNTFRVPLVLGEGKTIGVDLTGDTQTAMQGLLLNRQVTDTIIQLHLNTYSETISTSFIVPSGQFLVVQFLAHDTDGGAYHVPLLAIDGVTALDFRDEGGNLRQSSGPHLPLVIKSNSEVSLVPSSGDFNYGYNYVYGVLIDEDYFDSSSSEGAVSTLTPLTDNNIHEAVDLWLSDECSALLTYGHISDWDVSSVTDMGELFVGASSFNGDLSSWDVSSVIYMNAMFNGASFNSDISSWDVSNVINMGAMFEYNDSFNADLSSWDVSSVTNMIYMFRQAVIFNSDISAWDVSSVPDMSNMFNGATNFNGDLSFWDVSNVTNMQSLFYGATSFNGDLSSWDVSSVTDMNNMFRGASSFTSDLSSWDVSSVTNMAGMFPSATSFNGDISSWDVSSVLGMGWMFASAISFNGDLSAWDVSSVTDMTFMFYDASSFNGDLSTWDVSSVTNIPSMFDGASALSEENQCLIHTSFSSNPNWPYDWSEFCD